MIVFLFSVRIFMPLANLRFFRLHGQFLILRIRSCRDIYPFFRPPRRLLILDKRGGHPYSGFHLVHSYVSRQRSCPPPIRGVDSDFPFKENDTRRYFSYFSGTFRDYVYLRKQIYVYIPATRLKHAAFSTYYRKQLLACV